MTPDEFASQVRLEAAEAALNDDSRLLCRVVSTIQAIFKNSPDISAAIISKDNLAASPEEALDWWITKKNGLPRSLEFLNQAIREGMQPVLCSISLYVHSSAPTIYVPVPFSRIAINQIHGFCDSTWLNPPENLSHLTGTEQDDWERIASEFSHAVCNLAYTVRVDDEPLLGWLAKAHAKSMALYLPDVSQASEMDAGTLTTAVSDERFLGMASVMYIPLAWEDPLSLFSTKGRDAEYAQAVLLLWSPIPGRWNSLISAESRRIARFAMSLSSELGHIKHKLSKALSWLGDLIAKDEHDQKKMDAQLLAFLYTLDRWSLDRSREVRQEFLSLMHGMEALLTFIREDSPSKPTPAQQWLHEIILSSRGLMRSLETFWKRSLREVPFLIDIWDTEKRIIRSFQSSLGTANASINRVPCNAFIPFEGKIALRIGVEPVSNLKKYAIDVTAVSVFISSAYATLRLTETPDAAAQKRLLGNKAGFLRYFALRRGLAVPAKYENSGESYGIGLALFSLVATRARVYRKLYLSSDGEQCYVELSLPCERSRSGSNEKACQKDP